MTIEDYAKYDGIGLAGLVAKKKVKPSELVEEAIFRAEALNPKLNFLVYRDYDRARDAAKKKPKGVFGGVPFFLKDIFALAEGMPTRQAAQFLPPIPWPHDSVMTARFRAAGLIPLGKTNVPEFGLVATTESKLYGPAHNPWNLAHSTGGSSGGSAAAVAAGIVPLAHANDGGGSIRIPASACGLVGLKPTRGRTTFAPDFGDIIDGLANDLVVSRSVRDTAAALDAIKGNIPGDPYYAPPPAASYLDSMKRAPKKLRIAFATKKLDGQPLHADCVAAVKHAAKLCEKLGHNVEEASPALDQQALIPAFMAFWCGGLAAGIDTIAALTGQKPTADKFEGLTWGLYEAGKKIPASEYLMAKDALQRAAREAAKFHETYDVWLTATLGKPPVKLGTFDMEERDPVKSFAPMIDYVPFTAMQNATGQPAINLPLYWNKEGLPIGVQFVGRFGDEETLLKLAGQIEKAAPWADRYADIKV
ncbi:MAG TPA: amidase family protein [Rhizomicrobium sp.]|jgi:amidase|nr:amidase family protein [Rhizomicrobium sp.]